MPLFSVIVPTYNRLDKLALCLDALAKQDLPREQFEVIVVDDAGGRALDELVVPYRQTLNLTLLCQERNGGAGAARNAGAAVATGQYLAFTDDDCAPEPGWLSALARAVEEHPNALISGRVENAAGGNLYAAVNHALTGEICENLWRRGDVYKYATANNIAVPREEYLRLGGFNPEIRPAAEEREFYHHWLAAGLPTTRQPEALVRHDHAQDLGSFLRMHRRYGCGARALLERGRGATGAGTGPHEAGFYIPLLTMPFRAFAGLQAWKALMLVLLSQFAVAAGFWSRSLRALGPLTAAAAVYLLIVVAGQWSGGAFRVELSDYDEAAHYVTGLLFHDYVAKGFPGPPLEFAREFYLHYPKVGLGHWPPGLYVAEAAWMLLFSDSRASVLVLMAFLAALIAAVVCAVVYRIGQSWLFAFTAGLVFAALPAVQRHSFLVMAEFAVTLICLGAVLMLPTVLRITTTRAALCFGVTAALAILTKANAFALALTVPLAVAFDRAWPVLRKPAFWLPVPVVVVVAGPWYLWAVEFLRDEVVVAPLQAEPWLSMYWRTTAANLNTMFHVAGPVLLFLAGWGLASGLRQRRPLEASLGACALSVWIFVSWISPHTEVRHMVLLLPALAILAAIGALRLLGTPARAAVALAAGLALAWLIRPAGTKESYGVVPLVTTILNGAGERRPVLLVSSERSIEGAVIAEIAMREPRPGSTVLRASKLLAESGWMGQNYKLHVDSPPEIQELIERIPIDLVIFDPMPGDAVKPHHRLLRETLESYSGRWQLDVTSDAVRAYRLLTPRPNSDGALRLELPPKLGGDVGR
jgi:GT2 family glycosyltransferase